MYIFLKNREVIYLLQRSGSTEPTLILLYMLSLLLSPRAQQPYCTEHLLPLGHPVTVAVRRETVKETHCIYPYVKHHMN
jgi:hypothetical protein